MIDLDLDEWCLIHLELNSHRYRTVRDDVSVNLEYFVDFSCRAGVGLINFLITFCIIFNNDG